MISCTNPHRGSIDLLISLPLIMILLAGIFSTSLVLKKKIDLEKTSWRSLFHPQAGEKTHRPCAYEHISTVKSRLPASVRAYTLTHCSRRVEVNIRENVRPLPWVEVPLELSSSALRPGNDFQNSHGLKNLLWQENMAKAGFGSLPLRMLGLPELAAALGADVERMRSP